MRLFEECRVLFRNFRLCCMCLCNCYLWWCSVNAFDVINSNVIMILFQLSVVFSLFFLSFCVKLLDYCLNIRKNIF